MDTRMDWHGYQTENKNGGNDETPEFTHGSTPISDGWMAKIISGQHATLGRWKHPVKQFLRLHQDIP
jgi:hypothetical protein